MGFPSVRNYRNIFGISSENIFGINKLLSAADNINFTGLAYMQKLEIYVSLCIVCKAPSLAYSRGSGGMPLAKIRYQKSEFGGISTTNII